MSMISIFKALALTALIGLLAGCGGSGGHSSNGGGGGDHSVDITLKDKDGKDIPNNTVSLSNGASASTSTLAPEALKALGLNPTETIEIFYTHVDGVEPTISVTDSNGSLIVDSANTKNTSNAIAFTLGGACKAPASGKDCVALSLAYNPTSVTDATANQQLTVNYSAGAVKANMPVTFSVDAEVPQKLFYDTDNNKKVFSYSKDYEYNFTTVDPKTKLTFSSPPVGTTLTYQGTYGSIFQLHEINNSNVVFTAGKGIHFGINYFPQGSLKWSQGSDAMLSVSNDATFTIARNFIYVTASGTYVHDVIKNVKQQINFTKFVNSYTQSTLPDSVNYNANIIFDRSAFPYSGSFPEIGSGMAIPESQILVGSTAGLSGISVDATEENLYVYDLFALTSYPFPTSQTTINVHTQAMASATGTEVYPPAMLTLYQSGSDYYLNYSHYISSDNSIPFTSSFPKVTIPGSVSEDAEYNIAIDGGNASSSFLLAAGNVVYSGTLPSQGADNISLTQASPLSTYESIINYDVYIYQDKYGISAALLPVPSVALVGLTTKGALNILTTQTNGSGVHEMQVIANVGDLPKIKSFACGDFNIYDTSTKLPTCYLLGVDATNKLQVFSIKPASVTMYNGVPYPGTGSTLSPISNSITVTSGAHISVEGNSGSIAVGDSLGLKVYKLSEDGASYSLVEALPGPIQSLSVH